MSAGLLLVSQGTDRICTRGKEKTLEGHTLTWKRHTPLGTHNWLSRTGPSTPPTQQESSRAWRCVLKDQEPSPLIPGLCLLPSGLVSDWSLCDLVPLAGAPSLPQWLSRDSEGLACGGMGNVPALGSEGPRVQGEAGPDFKDLSCSPRRKTSQWERGAGHGWGVLLWRRRQDLVRIPGTR